MVVAKWLISIVWGILPGCSYYQKISYHRVRVHSLDCDVYKSGMVRIHYFLGRNGTRREIFRFYL